MLSIDMLQSLGFENEREYNLYLKIKESMDEKKVPVGIAS